MSSIDNTPTTKNSAAQGVLWASIDKFSIVFLQFIINLVLARLLVPEDFGMVGMILIIVAVSTILADGGFGSALIQKHSPTEEDYSTAFCINISTSLLIYGIIYLSAPWVAELFEIPILQSYLRVLGTVIVINAFGLVSKVVLRRSLAFKQIAISNICAYIIAATSATLMALNGYGAWSLIAVYIVNAIFANIFIYISAHWSPKKRPNSTSLKQLFAYGEFMLASDILSNICFHIQGTVVGKYFTPYVAGQYAQAKKMEEVACVTFPSAINQVLFPLYSRLQYNTTDLRGMLQLNTKTIAFIIFPLLTLLIIIAEPLIMLLFGPKWADSVVYFQALCIGGYFCALQYLNYHAVAAIGKSKILFYAGTFKSTFLISSLFIGANISMWALLLGMVLSNVVNYLTNAILSHICIGYRIWDQLLDVVPLLIHAMIAGVITYYAYNICGLHWVLSGVIYTTIYITTCYLSNNEIFFYVIKIGKRFVNSINNK